MSGNITTSTLQMTNIQIYTCFQKFCSKNRYHKEINLFPHSIFHKKASYNWTLSEHHLPLYLYHQP